MRPRPPRGTRGLPPPLRIQSRLAPDRPGPATVRLSTAGRAARGGRWGCDPPAASPRLPRPGPPEPRELLRRPPHLPGPAGSRAPHAATGAGASGGAAALRALPAGERQGAGSPAPAQHPGHFLPARPAPLPERPPSRLAPSESQAPFLPAGLASPRSPELGRVFVWELASFQFGAHRAN